jgi:glycosyltransferase involved in cell wall biosynthesis
MERRLKVLLSAYACEAGKGSEPGVGWNWARQVARFHEVWVITRANNREPIEKALVKNPLPNAHFIYFDLPRWTRFWKRGQRGVHLYYYLWQLMACIVTRKIHRQVGFDIGHHVTFVNYWLPSFLALLPIPYIWGPVGGGEFAPRAFRSSFSLRGRIYELTRDLARRLGELDPLVRRTARRASLGLATTQETAKRMRALGCPRVEVMSAVALAEEETEELGKLPLRTDLPFRVLSLGRLLHLKGFHLGVEAFAQFHRGFPQSEYWLIGEGPDRKWLERLAHKLGLDGKVRFWGAVERARALELLAECTILVHPSLHDSGGWVCLEAMAAGRPVICLDLGGPAFQVTDETGIKVLPLSPEQAVRDLAAAMLKLAAEPDLRTRMGKAGRQRIQDDFSWDKKGNVINQVYLTVKTGNKVDHPLNS